MLEARLKKPVEHIYEVSALSKLKNSGNQDDWETLTEDLRRLASKSGQDMTRAAAERGMRRFSASLRRSIEERVRALKEPIANSEQRIASLRQTVSQAEQSLRDLGALFSAEQMRLSNILLARRKKFFRQRSSRCLRRAVARSKRCENDIRPSLRRELMALAQTIARRHVMPWLDS